MVRNVTMSIVTCDRCRSEQIVLPRWQDGTKHGWFQWKRGKLPHYDLTEGKRSQAVAMGAVELDRQQASEKRKEIRSASQRVERKKQWR